MTSLVPGRFLVEKGNLTPPNGRQGEKKGCGQARHAGALLMRIAVLVRTCLRAGH